MNEAAVVVHSTKMPGTMQTTTTQQILLLGGKPRLNVQK